MRIYQLSGLNRSDGFRNHLVARGIVADVSVMMAADGPGWHPKRAAGSSMAEFSAINHQFVDAEAPLMQTCRR